jgi:hypothetical protein
MRQWTWQIALRLAVLVAGVAVVTVQAASGGSAANAQTTAHPSVTPTPSQTSPSDDTTNEVSGAGFRTALPAGWSDRTRSFNAAEDKSDAAALLDRTTGGAVVVTTTAGAPDEVAVMRFVVSQEGGRDGHGPRPYRLVGARGVTETFKTTRNGQATHDRLIIVTHGSQAYIISFTSPAFDYRIASEDLGELLSGWEWTS